MLVTGGAGYIGSVVSDWLIEQGHTVTVVDSMVSGHDKALPKQVRLVHSDVADRAQVLPLLHEVDVVMHFAAFIEAGESMEVPDKYFDNNTVKTYELIKMASEAEVKGFVFSSTAAVYASKDTPLVETDPLGPVNVYGESKKISEEMLHWYATLGKLPVCVLRYFNAAGASLLRGAPQRGAAHKSDSHLIPNILRVPLGQKDNIVIFGDDYETPDGTCVRDYVHVDDLAQAHILAAEALMNRQFSWEIFNLGNGNGHSNLEVLAAARAVTGHKIPRVMGPRREGDGTMLVADSTKAKAMLGWKPAFADLDTIVRSAWEWHKSHPHGYTD